MLLLLLQLRLPLMLLLRLLILSSGNSRRILGVASRISVLLPGFVPIRLVFQNEQIYANVDVIFLTAAQCASSAILHPSWQGKVGGFRDLEALIIAGMIAVREFNYELPFLLSDFVARGDMKVTL